MLAIKNKVAATPALSTLVGRMVVNNVGKLKLSDGPYCRVSVADNDADFGFQDDTGIDSTIIQFSVFGQSDVTTLNAVQALADQIIKAFHGGDGLTLGNTGKVAHGTRRTRGIGPTEPKASDSTPVHHCYVTILFQYEDVI